jgi:ectoine hydroxylase-related dioxygenase (phytanoyl-CoA dioxygenase family)
MLRRVDSFHFLFDEPKLNKHVFTVIACPISERNTIESSVSELKETNQHYEWSLLNATQTQQHIYLLCSFQQGEHVNHVLNESENKLHGEVILTAPCPIPLFHASFKDLTCSFDHQDDAIHLFKETGLIHFKNAIHEYQALRQVVHERIQKAQTLDTSYDPCNENIAYSEWASRGKKRFDLLFDLEEFAELKQLSQNGPWMPFIHTILNANVQCMVSVVYSLPGATSQSWHADGGHYGKDTYAVCFFVPLIPLNESVGYTQFWTGSHKNEGLIGFGAAAELLEGTVDAIGNDGDAILYDYRLMHRGMANHSDQLRPILQFVYHVPWYTETKNYGSKSLFPNSWR